MASLGDRLRISYSSGYLLPSPDGLDPRRLCRRRTPMAAARRRIANQYAGLFWGRCICRSGSDGCSRNDTGNRLCGLGGRLSRRRRNHERRSQRARIEYCRNAMVFSRRGRMCRRGRDVPRCPCIGAPVAINSVLRPLSRYIDRRSLAVLDTPAFYRLRLRCDREHQVEAEYQLTRAIAARSLVLHEIRSERVEDTDDSIIQAVLESTTHDSTILKAMVEELRAFPWAQSVEWTETGADVE